MKVRKAFCFGSHIIIDNCQKFIFFKRAKNLNNTAYIIQNVPWYIHRLSVVCVWIRRKEVFGNVYQMVSHDIYRLVVEYEYTN